MLLVELGRAGKPAASRARGGRMLSKVTRRGLIAGIAGTMIAPAVLRAEGEGYPERPVRFIIPSGPGGSPDILTRLLVDRMAKNTGRQFVVDYRPGGGTSVA